MKKTLMLLLAVCMMAVMVPASFAFADDGDTPEEPVQEQQFIAYESKMSLNEGEIGWQQDPETKVWKYWDGSKYLTDKQQIGGSFYYFDGTGALKTGWVQLTDGNKNYFDPTPGTPGAAGSTYGVMKTGWLKLKSDKYYLNTSNGNMYTGMHTISGSKYYFASNGKMKTGWVTFEEHKYYFNPKNGKMKTGWLKLDGAKYYLDPKSGKMKTGWVKIESDKYYFASNGKMKTGWLTLDGKKYRLDPKSGKMETGFRKISKKKYYFDSNGVMQTGLKTIKGYKYYFDSKGVMKTGAIKISGSLYYFYSSGKAVKNTGWFKGSDKKQRYSLGGGKIAIGEKKIGGTWYVFSTTTGILISSMDTYDKNMQSKSSKTAYLIQVIRKNHQVRIYKGKKGNWNKIYTFTCSVGKKETPTPTGTFKIYQKLQKHEVKDPDTGVKVRCWGLCRFYKGDDGTQYALNSIIYRASDGSVYDGRLGVNNSRGSVRTSYNNAMWIYNNIPVNTAVIVVA
ncbi:MAG: L,D-transpeptidase family protein [Eubacterium sp.]|nr:L,D-transpeptidase family protein [Eubacterium sp.]